MKKIINKIYLVIGILVIGTSCNDFLNETPIDKISSEYVYTTEAGLQSGVAALYNLQRENNFPTGSNQGLIENALFYIGTDLGHNRTFFDPYGPNHNAVSFGKEKWVIPYRIIDRCNAIIANAEAVDMDSQKKDKLIAQARAIRAELYLDLISTYDNIVLKTEPTTSDNISSFEYKPADPKDVFKVIDSDLDFAISKLDWVVSPGRYGQGVARHIRGKSALWQKKWQEAADQFDAIVTNGTHHLVALNKVFSGDRNNAESLYTYQFDRALGGGSDLAGGAPTQYGAIFNNRYYELSSGEMIQDVSLGGQAFGWSYPNDYLQSLYDKDNDLRYTTYYYSTTLYVNNSDKPNYGQPLPKSSYEDNYRRYHWSLKKFHDDGKPKTSTDSYVNCMYYRFAETLLLGAEAHWRLSGNNTDPKALEYINMIRERAFGNNSHKIVEMNLDSYLDESARELAFENNRWFLLKRLGLLVERQNLHFTIGSSSSNTKLKPMASYMVRFPIPQSQIDLMGTFPQNPGY